MRWLITFIYLLPFHLSSAAQIQRYSVVINEFMADPSPPQGLPAVEYIELKNNSPAAIDLTGWHIATASSRSGNFPSLVLQPDSFVVLCSSGGVTQMAPYGRTVAIGSFPSLPNAEGLIALYTRTGILMHALSYEAGWHHNEVKQEGGWSLEMIDPALPCGEAENWAASTDARGGTPGYSNSISSKRSDQLPPKLLRTYSIDSLNIVAVFSEALDSNAASLLTRYVLDPPLGIRSATARPPLFRELQLSLTTPMLPQMVYTLSVNGIIDCAGNAIGTPEKASCGAVSEAVPGSLRINEILFDPRVGGTDHIEILHTGKGALDAGRVYISNKTGPPMPVSIRPFLIFPGDHMVVTEDASITMQQYFVAFPGLLLKVPSLPTFPDDKGRVAIYNSLGQLLEEVNYNDSWQFELLAHKEGVSLERIDPVGPPGEAHNWHSASASSGYGTPTARNSQWIGNSSGNGIIEMEPEIFSPNGDGRDDLLLIRYTLPEPGWYANLSLFDASGHLQRQLVQNEICGRAGSWKWDGLNDLGHLCKPGVYVLLAEFIRLQGRKKVVKKVVVLVS